MVKLEVVLNVKKYTTLFSSTGICGHNLFHFFFLNIIFVSFMFFFFNLFTTVKFCLFSSKRANITLLLEVSVCLCAKHNIFAAETL